MFVLSFVLVSKLSSVTAAGPISALEVRPLLRLGAVPIFRSPRSKMGLSPFPAPANTF